MESQIKGSVNGKVKKDKILASGTISHRDTNILDEDLFNETSLSLNRVRESKKWVWFLDRNLTFLKNLMALIENSTTLGRVIGDKARMATGDGFIPNEGNTNILLAVLRKVKKALNIEDRRIIELNEHLARVNRYNESLADVCYRAFYDFFGFGNVVAEIVRTEKGGKRNCYLYVHHLYKVAPEFDAKGMPTKYGFSEEWEKGDRPDDLTEVAVYPEWSGGEGESRTVIHLKNYAPAFVFWGIPEWIAARFWAEVEYRIPKYNIGKFKNGFTPSAVVQFFGSVSKTEAESVIKKFKETFTDTGNNDKIFAQVLKDERLKANVQLLEDKSEGNFIELGKTASQAIVTACRWTMSLAGFATAGKLGTNQQMRQELEYVHNVGIKPVVNKITEGIVNVYLKEAGEWMGASWKDIRVTISNNMPVSFAGDVSPEDNLLINEKRELLGYEALDEVSTKQLLNERRGTSSGAIPALEGAEEEISEDEEMNI